MEPGWILVGAGMLVPLSAFLFVVPHLCHKVLKIKAQLLALEGTDSYPSLITSQFI